MSTMRVSGTKMMKALVALLVAFVAALAFVTVAQQPAQAQAATKSIIPMNRLYNPNSGEHFYTGNVAEKENLVRLGWVYEGIGWYAPSTSNTPVHRLYNANAGEHHYTRNASERDMLVRAGWKYEGIGWYSDDNKTISLYREYNPNAFANNHNYTTSSAEHNMLLKAGWRDEGDDAWYGVETQLATITVKGYGTIQVALDEVGAPKTTANFIKLANQGFYDNTSFHRIWSGFMIQGGDPRGDGTGGSGTFIEGEFSDNKYDNPISHTRGTISMARGDSPNSASSQFFIVHEDATGLDGKYAAFGRVISGMDVVDRICANYSPDGKESKPAKDLQPVITSIRISKTH